MSKMKSSLMAAAAAAAAVVGSSPVKAEDPDPVKIGVIDLRGDSLTYKARGVDIQYKEFTPEGMEAGRQEMAVGGDHGHFVVSAAVRHYRDLDRRRPIQVYAANPFGMNERDGRKFLHLDFAKGVEALRWMKENGVKVVVTAFNSRNKQGSKFLMDHAEQMGMVVFAGYSNANDAGTVYPAADHRSISVVDTKIGKLSGDRIVPGTRRTHDAAEVGIDFAMDGSVPMGSHGQAVSTGSSYASAKAGAYGAYYVAQHPEASTSDIRNALLRTADSYEVTTENGKFEMPFLGKAAMSDRFRERVDSAEVAQMHASREESHEEMVVLTGLVKMQKAASR